MALSEDVLVVGAPWEDDAAGACYVFSRDGTRVQRLVADGKGQFGQAVAISDSFVFVGAWLDGAVFVFTNDQGRWTRAQKLIAPAPNALFGVQVAVAGHVLVVGASDSVFVYTLDGTTWKLVLAVAPSTASRSFGTSLAVKNDGLFVVGAPSTEDDNRLKSGAVYVYQMFNCAQIFLRYSGNETVRARYTFASTTTVVATRTLTSEESQEVCLVDDCYSIEIDSDSADIAWTYATISRTTNTPTQLALRNGQVFATCDDDSSTASSTRMPRFVAFVVIACVAALLAACCIALGARRRRLRFKTVCAAHVPASTDLFSSP